MWSRNVLSWTSIIWLLQSKNVRDRLWNEILNTDPSNVVCGIDKMKHFDRYTFILNGFNVPYVGEWRKCYSAPINFVFVITNEIVAD